MVVVVVRVRSMGANSAPTYDAAHVLYRDALSANMAEHTGNFANEVAM